MKIWNFHQSETIPEVLNKYLRSNFPWVGPQLLWMPGIPLLKLGPYVSNSTPDPNHHPWIILSFTLQYILNNSVGLVQCTCLYMVKTEILSNSDDEHDACAPVLCMLSMLGCAVVAAEVAFCCSVLLLLFSTLLLLLVSNSRLHQRLLWDRGGEEARGIQNTNYYHIAHREQDYMQLFIGSKKEIFKNCTHKYVP